MSKIYEALQRAEQERLTHPVAAPAAPAYETPEQEMPELVQPSAYGDVSPAEAPVAYAPSFVHIPDGPAVPAPFASAPAVSAPLAPPASADSAHLFAAVVRTPWKPQLDKLPALEERGRAVEQFRSLRTRLFAFRDLNKLKSIMIGSGLPREGKSFIAANLAVSFARHKSARVLLIDGDMRRSSLHTLFGCERAPGLSSYLAGRAEIPDILQRMQVPPKSIALAGLGSLTFIGGGDEGARLGAPS